MMQVVPSVIDSLAARGVAPHIYETADDARAHVRD